MPRRIALLLLLLAVLLPTAAADRSGRAYAAPPPQGWSARGAELASSLGLDPPTGERNFIDRTEYAAALQRAFGRTVEARPGPLTRADVAGLLVEALGYGGLAAQAGSGRCPCPDLTRAGWEPVALCLRLGLLDAPAEGAAYFPDDPAPYEEAAAALALAWEPWAAPTGWLHGFYAFSSYSQIEMTAQLDAVSVGWALLDVDGADGPFLNQSFTNGNGWALPPDSDLATDYFSANGTPCHLNVYAGPTALTLADGTVTNDLYGILETPEARERAVALLAEAAGDYAGLTIDIEGLQAPLREPFSAFMAALRAALPGDKALYVCVPPPDWYGGYDYRALGAVCDKVILMAHDYQWPSVPADYVGDDYTDIPVTPFGRVFSALLALTDPETGVEDKSKLALQLSIASAGLEVDENGVLLSRTIYSPGPGTVIRRLRQPDTAMEWSDYYKNAVITYTTESGMICRLWYEDARGAAEKLRLARLLGVEGVSLWRLGIIPDYADEGLHYDVWSAVTAGR